MIKDELFSDDVDLEECQLNILLEKRAEILSLKGIR